MMRRGFRGLTTLVMATLVVAGCSSREATPPIPTADDADGYQVRWPAGLQPPGEALDCPDGGEQVATAEELQDGLETALPGDVIQLADGEYEGQFRITKAGTRDEPIWLCGSRDAVLHGQDVEQGTVLRLVGGSHWNLVGFTVRTAKKGLMVEGSNESLIQGLSVHDIGDEAIHLKGASSGNVVRDNDISDTGNRREQFGEGVYVGSAESNWCEETACEPDRSDRNIVMDNVISGTTSEAVDVKEGTSGGVVVGNVFDGDSLTGDADSWVDVKGNRWLVQDNRGNASPRTGFEVQSVVDGWGDGNVLAGNSGDVNGADLGIDVRGGEGNVVTCDNDFEGTDEAKFNVECVST